MLRRRTARRNLQPFIEYTTPNWVAGKIHRIICEQLERVTSKQADRILILAPPQHGKSTGTSRRFPAFALGHDPTQDVISASATAQLAEEFGRDVRNCIASTQYKHLFPKTVLSEDSTAKGRWNTNQGGGYYAVGFGGALLGRGGNLGIIDDPFATWEDAQSQLQRDKVWDWYQGTFYNRMRPGAPVICIQHRMHSDDLAGRLIEKQKTGGDKWEIVELPALLEDPPWPERYDRKALERIKANSSPMQWSSLYLQNPMPDEGTFFKRGWFKRYVPEQLPKNVHYYLSSDHAPSGSEDGDYNCIRVWGLAGDDLYLVDGFRHQETIDKAMERVIGDKARGRKGLIHRYTPLCWFPEDDNNWKSVAGYVTKEMRRQGAHCRIEPISPHGKDKIVKAQAFQGMASMGMVWLPVGPDGDDVLEQYTRFPGGKNDDEVDAASVIGRCIHEAHPAMADMPDEEVEPEDRYRDVEPEEERNGAWG